MAEKDLDTQLPNHLALAIGQLAHAKHHRENTGPGLYTIDETVRIHAVVRVEKDVLTKQVNKIDPWTILSLALDKLNDTTLDLVLSEAQAIIDAKDSQRNTELKEIKAKVEAKIAGLKDSTKSIRKGRVQILSQTVEVVQVASRKRKGGVEVSEVVEEPARPLTKAEKKKAQAIIDKEHAASSPASPIKKAKLDKSKAKTARKKAASRKKAKVK